MSNSIRMGEEEFYDPNMFLNRPLINLNNRVALGFTLYTETSGPLRHTGLLFAYAYHIPLHTMRLSFGLAGMLAYYNLNTSEFKPIDTNDLSLYTNTSAFIPDVNVGSLLYDPTFFLGFSANGFVNMNKIMDHTSRQPDFNLCGGYRFVINKKLKFEPSLFIMMEQEGTLFDLNGKLYIRDKGWLLLAYRSNGEVTPGFGIRIKKVYQLNYIYAITTRGLAGYNYGSHQISLRVYVTALVRQHQK